MNRKQEIKNKIIYILLIVLGLVCFVWNYSKDLMVRMTPTKSYVDGNYYNYWVEDGVLFSTYIVDGYKGNGTQSYQYNYVEDTGKKDLRIKTDENVVLNIRVYSNDRILFMDEIICRAGVDEYIEMDFIQGEELYIDVFCESQGFDFAIGVD